MGLDKLGNLYETGLAEIDKQDKKNLGKYYTPPDVALVMSGWLKNLAGDNIADIGCGTGNLTIAYLSTFEKVEARNLIESGKIHLYDIDPCALKIAKYIIAIKYGEDLFDSIVTHEGDYLRKDMLVPSNCKVISNPPYAKIQSTPSGWGKSIVVSESRELYAAFFEKILKTSKSSVIISPYSFCNASKFYSLRVFMNDYGGYIYSFDNVPGNIFRGKKHGTFNSNHANSVRASITVTDNKKRGYRLTPLIRFSTNERERLLHNKTLESFLGDNAQTVSENEKCFCRCPKELEQMWQTWKIKSKKSLEDLVQLEPNRYAIHIPTTCRYYCVGSKTNLRRTGKHTIYAKDKKSFIYLYCLINSSFLYWYWRMFDGGINMTQTLLYSLPVFLDNLDDKQNSQLEELFYRYSDNEKLYFTYKKNAGVIQQNVKFPPEIRKEFNRSLIKMLGLKQNLADELEKVHSNNAFSEEAGNV